MKRMDVSENFDIDSKDVETESRIMYSQMTTIKKLR